MRYFYNGFSKMMMSTLKKLQHLKFVKDIGFLHNMLPPQYCVTGPRWVNTLRPRQNGPHYTDDIFKSIFLNEYVWIPIKISLRIVPKGPINNIPALIQIMAWRRSGDKPLSEPNIASLPMHICVARPQRVNLVATQYFNGFMQKRRNSIASNWSYVTLAPSH